MEILANLQPPAGNSGASSIIMIAIIIVIFYFSMIRPNMKKQKEAKKFRENLAVGQKVITIGGVHGKILEVAESTVLINSEGSKLRLEKSAIASSTDEQIMPS